MTRRAEDLKEVLEIIETGNDSEKPMFMITNDREISARDALIAYSRRWRMITRLNLSERERFLVGRQASGL